MNQRFLTSWEEATFLARHPLTAARVAAFNLAVSVLGYDQIYNPPAWYEFDVAIIPTTGLCVRDASFGNVLIFPNAYGVLYFTAFVPDGPCSMAEQVLNDGEYQSPSGGLDLSWLTTAGALVVIGAGVYLYVNRGRL